MLQVLPKVGREDPPEEMIDPVTPPHVPRSAIGQDTSIKRASGGKHVGRLLRGGNMGRSSSSGSILAIPRGPVSRRKLLILALLVTLLSLSTFFVIRDRRLLRSWDESSEDESESVGLVEAKGPARHRGRRRGRSRQSGGREVHGGQDGERQEKSRRRGRHKKTKTGKADKTGGAALPLLPAQFNPLDPVLPAWHPCANFTLPPPPTDRKRTGPRPCPVCYLPTEEAAAAWPRREREWAPPGVKQLEYVSEEDETEQAARRRGRKPRFAGHQSLEQRRASFQIQEKMKVHCGFVWGSKPGTGTGFDFSASDAEYLNSCSGVVVASAIFGAYDLVQQPVEMSERAQKEVCFTMFVDEPTSESLMKDGTLPDKDSRRVGLWRLVVVTHLPYGDPRRTGKIPKLLTHRLFPNAQFSLWIDAKLELRVDPFRLLERFLWRGNFTWAISKHYKRFDVFEEAERNKEAGKYNNASIEHQMEVYRSQGMTPYSDAKLPIISDVPEGCVIMREHMPLTNLLACIWFNEVDRFTSRDQLSFGFARDRIRAAVPGWNVNMFLDCERRNFVVQVYHKNVLLDKFGNSSKAVATDRAEWDHSKSANPKR